MNNHLEQLVSEWLQYNRFRARFYSGWAPSERGPRGELDVVAVNFARQHVLHVECSLDALSDKKRQAAYAPKFERGRRFKQAVFEGVQIPENFEQVAVLQFTSGHVRQLGGVRVVTVRELIHEIYAGLEGTSPGSKAVPSNLPLLRTLQLAADATKHKSNSSEHRLLRTASS